MVEVTAERGYAAASLTEVLRRARVSRESFYQQFSSKEDCFMAAFETAVEVVLGEAFGEVSQEGAAIDRFNNGLRAYLDAMARRPAFARVFLIEVYAAGPAALRRRSELQTRFVGALDEIFGYRAPEERFANEAVVAAASAMVTARLAVGDVDGVRALFEPLSWMSARLR